MKYCDLVKHAKILIIRLERISADSVLAHQVSGIRGSLLKMIDSDMESFSQEELTKLDRLISLGYDYMEQACRDMVR